MILMSVFKEHIHQINHREFWFFLKCMFQKIVCHWCDRYVLCKESLFLMHTIFTKFLFRAYVTMYWQSLIYCPFITFFMQRLMCFVICFRPDNGVLSKWCYSISYSRISIYRQRKESNDLGKPQEKKYVPTANEGSCIFFSGQNFTYYTTSRVLAIL